VLVAFHYLLAFGFGNLAMLGWLAAAAAPFLIHLWSRHRFREAPWAAMQFLLAAMRKNARRMQLQQWLLLAVRTLLVTLVVLAVAEPYGETLVAGGSSTPAHKVLAIDGSFSMAYRDNGESRFARAKRLATGLVRDSRAGDLITVILMSSPAQMICSRETVDHEAVAARIESITPTHGVVDLSGTLALIHDALSDENAGSRSKLRQEVYFFTDLQRTTWQATGSHPQRGNEKLAANDRLIALTQHAGVSVIDVGEPQAQNLAITQLATSEPFITPGREIPFEVTVRQFGQERQPECKIELFVDDVPTGEQSVDVPAAGEATASFSHRFHSAGDHIISVRAAADRLDIDNSRSIAVTVRDEIRVLCVAGKEGATKYLSRALDPKPDAPSAIRPIVVSEGDLVELDFSDFDCMFLCNVAQLTATEAERLARYTAGGGGVVFFLGDRVIPASYNAYAPKDNAESIARNPQSAFEAPSVQDRVEKESDRQALLPARIGELISQSHFGLDPLNYRHPIVAPFRGRERAGLLTTPIVSYYRLDMSSSPPDAETAAALRGGDPFIVTAPLGRGRVVLVATDGSLSSIDPVSGEPWTTWPTWPSFLPIVRELLAYAVGGQHIDWQHLVGATLGGSLSDWPTFEAATDSLKIARPDGHSAAVAIETSDGEPQWSFSDTNLSGIYSLRGLPGGQTQTFAVNVDTTESDLAKIDPQQLPPSLVVRGTWQNTADGGGSSTLSNSAWSGRLLWIALALLFVESLMAWQFGRGGA
jgi:hypothetical protein